MPRRLLARQRADNFGHRLKRRQGSRPLNQDVTPAPGPLDICVRNLGIRVAFKQGIDRQREKPGKLEQHAGRHTVGSAYILMKLLVTDPYRLCKSGERQSGIRAQPVDVRPNDEICPHLLSSRQFPRRLLHRYPRTKHLVLAYSMIPVRQSTNVSPPDHHYDNVGFKRTRRKVP